MTQPSVSIMTVWLLARLSLSPLVCCLLAQFLRTVMSMSRDEVLAPFHTAFASSDPARGGCPTVP